MTIYGFKPSEFTNAPEWANKLRNLYWVIRVERKNKAKVRRYYRLVYKEKLRLVEVGVRFELVDAVCKYFIKLDRRSVARLEAVLNEPERQLRLPFFDPSDFT